MEIRNKNGKRKWSWTEEETKSLTSLIKYFLFIIFCVFVVIYFGKEIMLMSIIIKGLISKM